MITPSKEGSIEVHVIHGIHFMTPKGRISCASVWPYCIDIIVKMH